MSVACGPRVAAENLLEIQILRIQVRSGQIPIVKQRMSRGPVATQDGHGTYLYPLGLGGKGKRARNSRSSLAME